MARWSRESSVVRRLVLILAAGSVACTPVREVAPPEADLLQRQAAIRTFAVGLGSIVEKYIEPVHIDDIVVEGLRGLGSIDPAITVTRENDRLSLLVANHEAARFALPGEDDVDGWARLVVDVSATSRARSAELRKADMEHVYEAVFDGALSHLDVFSRYAGADEARRDRARREGFGGIGVRFQVKDGQVRVMGVSADTPAAAAGVEPGDIITHIDGFPTDGMNDDSVTDILRGEIRSHVILTVRRAGVEHPLRFNLERAYIVPETVLAEDVDGYLNLKIVGFNQNTATSMAEILRAARKDRRREVKGIILDLRGNPGGLLRQSVRVADLFLGEGEISSTRGRHPDSLHRYDAGGGDLTAGLPLAVIIDGRSASAAEIVAAALQDRGRAVVIGTTSYGKGTVQTVVRLPNDGELTLTWSRFFTPSGYALHGLGVLPTVCTSRIGDAQRLIGEAVVERPKTLARLAEWRRVGLDEEDRRHELRADCPAQQRFGGTEIEVARRVLNDHTLLAQFLDVSSPTATASTVQRRP